MVYIVHGEDISKSRKLISNQQTKLGLETKVELSLIDTPAKEFRAAINQQDMFQKERLVVVNVSGIGRAKIDEHIEIIKNAPETTHIVILAEKSLPKSNKFMKETKNLKAKVLELAGIPKGNVFNFADSVFSKQRTRAYKGLSNLVEDEGDYFRLFSVLLYSLRNILYAKFESPLFEKLKPFQKSKISRQAKMLKKTTVKDILKTFYELDRKAKTGEITPDLMVTRAVEKVLDS
jgi:DNA polymerase III delta subunit